MSTELASFWAALSETALGVAIKETTWAYPILESVHLIGLGLLVGPIILFDLAILGRTVGVAFHGVGQLLLPAVLVGLLLNVVSGGLLFVSDAAEFAANPAFQAKMALIGAALANGALFQMRYRSAGAADARIGTAGKVQAAASIMFWISVVVAGRMIAYVG